MERYGLLGERLSHSFSKQIHEKLGKYSYELLPMSLEQVHAFLEKRDFKGVNVTIPYKQEVMPFCDYIDEFALKIGAVNTIVNVGGRLHAYNTDFYGFQYMLEKNNIDVCERCVYILGSGGTAKTAASVLRHLNAKKITVISRSADRSFPFADEALTYQQAEKIGDAQIIINTSPIGMYPNNEDFPIDVTAFPHLQAVVDVIYNPLETRLVYNAKQYAKETGRSIICANGLLMLVAQAVFASEYFTQGSFIERGKPFCIKTNSSAIDSIYEGMCREMRNIVVVGMPSAGKSTIGKAVAKLLNRQLVDIDSIIEQQENKTIPEIFNENGEDYFRKLEHDAIADASKRNGIVISTGGGALLNPENVCNLHQNGFVVFIDRPLSKLAVGGQRPLSKSLEALKEMYDKRYPIYVSVSDAIVKNDGAFSLAVEKVKEKFYESANN